MIDPASLLLGALVMLTVGLLALVGFGLYVISGAIALFRRHRKVTVETQDGMTYLHGNFQAKPEPMALPVDRVN